MKHEPPPRAEGRCHKCGSGAADTVVIFLFSSALPVQGQTGCVRHSPSGSVFVCTLEGCHPPSASHLRARRKNLNLADRRRTGTASSCWEKSLFLSFFLSLCNHLHLHLIISDYDSSSFPFNHKNTLERCIEHFPKQIHIDLNCR